MQPMLNIALRAARSAGELIYRSMERLDVLTVNEKEANDYVSEIDRAAEQAIIQQLRRTYPIMASTPKNPAFSRVMVTAPILSGSATRWTAPPTSCGACRILP